MRYLSAADRSADKARKQLERVIALRHEQEEAQERLRAMLVARTPAPVEAAAPPVPETADWVCSAHPQKRALATACSGHRQRRPGTAGEHGHGVAPVRKWPEHSARFRQSPRFRDTPAPTWRIVDSKGTIYTLDAFKIKGGEKRQVNVPGYVKDIAKVQVYCARAEVLLGEVPSAVK